MSRDAISVTLEQANLLWLRGRARASGTSVSRLLDRLVAEARAGRSAATAPRSVVGTVKLEGFDPDAADREIRAFFEASRAATPSVHESRRSYGRPSRRKARG